MCTIVDQILTNYVIHDYADPFIVGKNGPTHESKYITHVGSEWLLLLGANTGGLYLVDFSYVGEEERRKLLKKWYVPIDQVIEQIKLLSKSSY